MKLQFQHIASNCNPMPSTVSFLTNNVIAYCYKNQIGLYNLTSQQVYRNIHPVKQPYPNRANCLITIEQKQKYYIIVGYDSGDLVVYGSKDLLQWTQEQWIKQSSGILSVSRSLCQEYIAVNNNSSLVTVYRFDSSQQTKQVLQSLQQIQFPLNKTIQTVSLHYLPHQKTLLIFLGGVDQLIHCYSVLVNKPQQLVYNFSLTGHENAITKLTLTVDTKGNEDNQKQKDLLLASASKDGYIRLWKITKSKDEAKFHKNVKILKVSTQSQQEYNVFLDSVLISHQCSVTNLSWGQLNNVRKLFSSSLDCTICVWSQTEGDQSWSVESRMGQFLGNKNAYFHVQANAAGMQLLALNYIGSVLIWNYTAQDNKFTLRQSFNGHYDKVTDIAWNHSGDFLVSVSRDQTTRVMAQHHQTKKYHEISRAQIHGYDINTVTVLKTKDQTLDLIVCGADEKVVRVFEPPACFANYFNSFRRKNFHLFFNSQEEEKKYLLPRESEKQPLLYETYTQGGQQVLGLMTKCQRVERQKVVDYFNEQDEQVLQLQQQKVDPKQAKKINFSLPPNDDYLVKHTLWPQMNKLYGHPHQLQYICRSHDSKLLASSCKGLTKQASSVIVWDTETWKIKKVIQHHAYTVYGMEFSINNKLVTVSKDRRLAVFDGDKDFNLIYSYQAHSRAITSVSISVDQKYIVTGSRDKTIKIHSLSEQKAIAEYEFKTVVTAVAYCHLQGRENVICCGLLDGSVAIVEWSGESGFKVRGEVEHRYRHTQRVNGIRWNGVRFATCSDDHSVCVFKVEEW